MFQRKESRASEGESDLRDLGGKGLKKVKDLAWKMLSFENKGEKQ